MTGVIPSAKIIVFVLGIAAFGLLINELYERGLVPASPAYAIAVSLALANLAAGVAGLRTPQKLGWGIYLAASLAIFLLLGFSNPISAAIVLLPLAL